MLGQRKHMLRMRTILLMVAGHRLIAVGVPAVIEYTSKLFIEIGAGSAVFTKACTNLDILAIGIDAKASNCYSVGRSDFIEFAIEPTLSLMNSLLGCGDVACVWVSPSVSMFAFGTFTGEQDSTPGVRSVRSSWTPMVALEGITDPALVNRLKKESYFVSMLGRLIQYCCNLNVPCCVEAPKSSLLWYCQRLIIESFTDDQCDLCMFGTSP